MQIFSQEKTNISDTKLEDLRMCVYKHIYLSYICIIRL